MQIIQDVDKLEFHYRLDNGIHALNAYVHNACEKSFLEIIRTISNELGFHIEVETGAKKQGGLIDFYNFIASDAGKTYIEITTLVVTLLIYVFPRKPKDDKINTQLDIIDKAKTLEDNGIPLPKNIEQRLQKLYRDHKIRKQKSNFFKKLMQEKKVKELEVSAINEENHKHKVFFTIPRKDFEDYVLLSDDLESEFDNKAVIEVISPVLKQGRYLWRGIYRKENRVHEFSMLDNDFKQTVIDDGITFQNGTELNCELEICKKLDDEGEIYNS